MPSDKNNFERNYNTADLHHYCNEMITWLEKKDLLGNLQNIQSKYNNIYVVVEEILQSLDPDLHRYSKGENTEFNPEILKIWILWSEESKITDHDRYKLLEYIQRDKLDKEK